METKEDILSDLESDIDGDWIDIQNKIKEKEKQEYIKNNPMRFYLKFKEFYEILFSIFTSWDGKEIDNFAIGNLHVLIRRIFGRHGDFGGLPKSFEKLWNIFCDPIKYKLIEGVECKYRGCGKIYDVFYKDNHRHRLRARWEMEMEMEMIHGERGVNQAMEMPQMYRIKCPSCGCDILHLPNNCDIVGIFQSSMMHDEEESGGRKENDFIRQFESYI